MSRIFRARLAPALEMTDQLVRGIELAKEAVGAESARIEIYKELGDSPVTIGEDLGGVPVDRVGAGYPADNSLIQKHREEKASVFGACALTIWPGPWMRRSPRPLCL